MFISQVYCIPKWQYPCSICLFSPWQLHLDISNYITTWNSGCTHTSFIYSFLPILYCVVLETCWNNTSIRGEVFWWNIYWQSPPRLMISQAQAGVDRCVAEGEACLFRWEIFLLFFTFLQIFCAEGAWLGPLSSLIAALAPNVCSMAAHSPASQTGRHNLNVQACREKCNFV